MPTNNVPPQYLGTPEQPDAAVDADTANSTLQIGGQVGVGAGGGGGGGSSIPPGGQTPPPPGLNLIPPPAASTATAPHIDPEESAAKQAYFEIWGVEPPKGYIGALISKGMNLFEIIDHELSKSSVRRTQYYVDKSSNYAQIIAQLFGTR